MVESEAAELTEEVMLGAVTFGHEHMKPVIQAIIELAEHAAKEPWALSEPSAPEATALQGPHPRTRHRVRWPRPTRKQKKEARQELVGAAKKQLPSRL